MSVFLNIQLHLLDYICIWYIFFSRIQALAIGQALIDADLLDPILNVTTPFRDDFTLYRPAEVCNA